MNITIKNLKFSEFNSDETHCFEATVYLDGKRSFVAHNEGHGGCNNYYPLKPEAGEQKAVWGRVNEINEYLKTLPPVVCENLRNDDGTPFTYTKDLDAIIADLVNDALIEKDAKRILRRVSYLRDGKIYQSPAKFKPTRANLELIKKASWWDDSYVILNELPLSDVVEILRGAA